MQKRFYDSPIGEIVLAADAAGLTGLWCVGLNYFPANLVNTPCDAADPILAEAARWLDMYFSGREPDFMPPLHAVGTVFQHSVWQILRTIPYGTTTTYAEIARALAAQLGGGRGSARAVGGAVGRNPISILVPCHRVVGADGSLTGYAGSLEKKRALLELELAGARALRRP